MSEKKEKKEELAVEAHEETTYSEKDSLATKLAKIAKEIGVVKKEGKNSQQGYDFIRYAAVGGRMRDVFERHHVIILPEVESYEREEIQNKYGNVGYHYTLRMKFTVVNGDKPEETYERYWLSESADYGDKGINKAETAGTKYFLMRLFQISEVGEKEADETTPEMVKSGSKAQVKLSQDQVLWLVANYQKVDGLTKERAVAKVKGLNMATASAEAERMKNAVAELNAQKEATNKEMEALANTEILEDK